MYGDEEEAKQMAKGTVTRPVSTLDLTKPLKVSAAATDPQQE